MWEIIFIHSIEPSQFDLESFWKLEFGSEMPLFTSATFTILLVIAAVAVPES